MTMPKRVLSEQRLRHIPAQFSWIDQRLVFEGHLGRCDANAAALYLLLLTVADAQGLSYWGDARVSRLLGITPGRLARAREDLARAGLIAYERPLYQVLALEGLAMPTPMGAAPDVAVPAPSSQTPMRSPTSRGRAASGSCSRPRAALRWISTSCFPPVFRRRTSRRTVRPSMLNGCQSCGTTHEFWVLRSS